MTEQDDYWKQIGRAYRGKSGRYRVLVEIRGDDVYYRHVGDLSPNKPKVCFISTWLSWCKELLPA